MKADTQILDKKIELIPWLTSLEGNVIIEKLIQFRNAETKAWWKTTQNEKKASIMKGIEDADNYKLKPYSSAKNIWKVVIKFFRLNMQ